MTGRRARLLPQLSWVALCLVLSGVLVYAYLALVARALPTADYGWFGAYWSLSLVVGFGAFLPVELELTRLVHLRPAGAPLPARTFPVVAGVTVLSAGGLLLVWPLLSPALGGEVGLLWALLAVCAISAAQFTLRGLLLGRGLVGRHGVVLLFDALLRVLGAVVVAGLIAAPSAADFGWTLVTALAAAHLPLLLVLLARRPRDRRDRPEPPVDDGEPLRVRAIGQLMLATLSGQALLNAAPVLVTSAARPGEHALAAAFVASFTLVRLPLFVAVPLQSALIPSLTEVGATTDRPAQRRLVLRLVAVVAVATVLVAGLAWVAGVPVVSLVFGSRYALSPTALAVLAGGSVLHLGLLLATQALVASARHRDAAFSWLAGLGAAAVLFALVPDLVSRATLAFTVGSGVGLLVGVGALLTHRGQPVGTTPGRP